MKHSNRQKLIIISILLLCVGAGCVATRPQQNGTAYPPSNITVTTMTPKLKEKTMSLVESLYIDVEKRSEMLKRLESPHPANLKAVIESLVEIVPEDDYNQIRVIEILKSYLDYDIEDTDPPGQESRKDVLTASDIRRLATDTLIRIGEKIPIEPVKDKYKLSRYIDGWVKDLTSKDGTFFNAREKLVKYRNESIYVLIQASYFNNYMKTLEGMKRFLDYTTRGPIFIGYIPIPLSSESHIYKKTKNLLRCEEVKKILRYRLNEWSIPFLKEVYYNNKTSYKQKVNIYEIVKGIGEDQGIDYLKDLDIDSGQHKELPENEINMNEIKKTGN